MKYQYLVIADEDTLLGFRAVGVPGVAAHDREEALAALEAARRRKPGVIILTEEVADMLRAEVDELRLEETLPMVVEIPGARGPLPNRRALGDVIREAIGIRV